MTTYQENNLDLVKIDYWDNLTVKLAHNRANFPGAQYKGLR